jgi:hypothetical protein
MRPRRAVVPAVPRQLEPDGFSHAVESPVATAIKNIKLISRREERKQTLAQKVSERVAEIEQQKLALELASRRYMDEGARLVTAVPPELLAPVPPPRIDQSARSIKLLK